MLLASQNSNYSINFLNGGMAVSAPFSGITLGTTTVGTLFVEFKVNNFSNKTIFCLDTNAVTFHRGWSIEIFNRKISSNWYNGTDQRASIATPIILNKIYRATFVRNPGGHRIYVNNIGNYAIGAIPDDTSTIAINSFVFGGRRPSAPENRGDCQIFKAAYYNTSSMSLTNKLLSSGNFKDATYWWTGAQPNGKLPITSITQKRIQYNNITI